MAVQLSAACGNSSSGNAAGTSTGGATGSGSVTISAAAGTVVAISEQDWAAFDKSSGCVVFSGQLENPGSAATCAYQVPAFALQDFPPGVPFFNVVYEGSSTSDAGVQRWLLGNATPNCPSGVGWYFDWSSNYLMLCASTCSTVNADATAKVILYGGCPTGTLQ